MNELRYQFYSIFIVTILLWTAFSKLWLLLTDPFVDFRLKLPQLIIWLAVGIEFILVFYNVRFRKTSETVFLNTTVFFFFGLFATIRWLLGYTTCGCSSLEISPLVFVALDFGIVIATLCSPHGRAQSIRGAIYVKSKWQESSRAMQGRAFGLVLFLAFAVLLQLPQADTMKIRLLGDCPIKVFVMTNELNLVKNELSKGRVLISNGSSLPARVVGVSTSCQCLTVSEFQNRLIPAYGSVEGALEVTPTKAGYFDQRLEVYIDHPQQFRSKCKVVGNVLKGRKE